MLKDEDRIFKNLYNDFGWEIDDAIKRGDWSETKKIIDKGKESIIKEIKENQSARLKDTPPIIGITIRLLYNWIHL